MWKEGDGVCVRGGSGDFAELVLVIDDDRFVGNSSPGTYNHVAPSHLVRQNEDLLIGAPPERCAKFRRNLSDPAKVKDCLSFSVVLY